MDGTFVHPFDNHNFIAGHGTMGLEILEDAPDTAAVIAAIGGGGLITGIASAIKTLKPNVKVWGAEPETAAPAALSFAQGVRKSSRAGSPRSAMELAAKASFPDVERMRPIVDGSIVVTLEQRNKPCE